MGLETPDHANLSESFRPSLHFKLLEMYENDTLAVQPGVELQVTAGSRNGVIMAQTVPPNGVTIKFPFPDQVQIEEV